jgi:PKD repeat protein
MPALLCACGLMFALLSCEKHKDPFSASNTQPFIAVFEFKPDLTLPDASLRADGDSLKFRAGNSYPIALIYEDVESNAGNRKLRAHFRFVTGSGAITSNKFSNPSSDGLSFDIPASLDDEIFLTPDKSGLVDLQLQISDGVKLSETKNAATMFFENLKPVVRFRTQVGSQLQPPYGVDFDASTSADRDGEIDTYTWNFGDGEPSVTTRSNTIHHDYKISGTFSVRLKIKDTEGASDSLDQTVTTANEAPVAALSVTPLSGKAPLTIIYSARGSRDRDGSIVAYDITFGDGMNSQADSGSHTYTRDGDYPVRLIVRDNLGATNSLTRSVTVQTPPVPVLTVAPDSGAFPLSVQLDATDSQDPQGGQLTYEMIITGQSGQTSQVTYRQASVTHVFRRPDTYRITLTASVVRNGNTLNATTEKTVRAINLAPAANFTYTRDLGNVTFTSTSTEPNAPDDFITNYTWNFGDANPPQSGANLANVLHTYTQSGTYIVELTVTDNFGLSSSKKDTLEVR